MDPQPPKDFRTLVNGGDPDEKFPIPQETEFYCRPETYAYLAIPKDIRERNEQVQQGKLIVLDFLPAPAIQEIAEALIQSRTRFEDIRQFKFRYLWKRQGGKSQGRAALGKCVKASGLVKYEGEVDFYILISADHCAWGFTRWMMEALVFHELCHADSKEDEETGKVTPAVQGHEWEGFIDELKHYGPWRPVIKSLQVALHPTMSEQRNLFEEAPPPAAAAQSDLTDITATAEQLKAAARRVAERVGGSTA